MKFEDYEQMIANGVSPEAVHIIHTKKEQEAFVKNYGRNFGDEPIMLCPGCPGMGYLSLKK